MTARQRDCDSVVTSGRLARATQFFDAAEHLEDNVPSAWGDLDVNAGITPAQNARSTDPPDKRRHRRQSGRLISWWCGSAGFTGVVGGLWDVRFGVAAGIRLIGPS